VFVHPIRVTRLRGLTIAAVLIWAASCAIALWQDLTPGWPVKGVLLACVVYFSGLGFIRENPSSEG
jgi:phosphatidylcholine synthase